MTGGVVFFGAGAFGLPTLAKLHRRGLLRAVVSQPDRPAGRRRRLAPTPVAAWAAEHAPDLPLERHERVNAPEVAERLRAVPADAWVVIAFGQKLGPDLLADRFAVNLHASLLPRWRGAAPINHAILAGDAVTGNSVITLADRMDAGLVLAQSRRPIEPEHTTGDLHDLLAEDGPALVLDVLARHAAGTLAPAVQDASQVTLACKLSRADGTIDFAETAVACRNRIHGLNPWPGVTTALAGAPLKLLRAATADAAGAEAAGTLVDAAEGIVRCGGATSLRLVEVQPAGRRPMSWAAFQRGAGLRAGVQLGDESKSGGQEPNPE